MANTTIICTPICLFTYNRLAELKQTVAFLQKNYLAPQSKLYIFSDGPKKKDDVENIKNLRAYLKTIKGFLDVTIVESENNKGLAKSIIEGVSGIIAQYGSVIVLEDDLLLSPNFLNYMNEALEFYQGDDQIFSIAGYTMPLKFPDDYNYDYYFSVRGSSWGWATWGNRWEKIDWEIKDYEIFNKSRQSQRSFNKGGSDLTGMLKNQMNGKIDSWAIRWCYNQWKLNQLTLYPRVSKVKNIGFHKTASHTKHRIKEFEATLDPGATIKFSFSDNVILDQRIAKLFRWYFSIPVRLKNKLLNFAKI